MITGAKEGPSDAEVEKFINVRAASGLTAAEAKENVLEFEGAGAAAKGKNISDAEYEKAKVLQSRFAATAGGGPGAAGTFGKLGGLLLGLRKFDKAEDLVAAESQFNRILSKGVGDNPTLIKQSAQVAGAFVKEVGPGIVKDERELAAIAATASRINPETAAETMKSTNRVFRGFDEKWGPLLKKTGITERDTYSQAAGKLFSHLEQVERSGKAVDAYLAEQGVDQHGAINTMSMFRYRNFLKDTNVEEGVYAPDADTRRRGIVPGRRMTGREAMAEIDRKYTSDVSLRTRVGQAKLDAAKLRNAMPLQYAKEIELEALKRMEERGEGTEMAASQIDYRMIGGANFPLLPSDQQAELGKRIRIEQEMHKIAKEKGQDVPGRPNDTSLLGGYTFDYLNWIKNREDQAAYSSVGSTLELTNKVGGPPRKPAFLQAPEMKPPAPAPEPKQPEAPGPQAAAYMGWRGALTASVIGAVPTERPSSTVAAIEPAAAEGSNASETNELLRQIVRLLEAGQKNQKTAPPKPLVEPRPALRR
jgi:hypothetical protein